MKHVKRNDLCLKGFVVYEPFSKQWAAMLRYRDSFVTVRHNRIELNSSKTGDYERLKIWYEENQDLKNGWHLVVPERTVVIPEEIERAIALRIKGYIDGDYDFKDFLKGLEK